VSLVALAAGPPSGRALFHMIPASLAPSSSDERVSLFLVFGLALFMGLEQLPIGITATERRPDVDSAMEQA
jgi:hypothetical protein